MKKAQLRIRKFHCVIVTISFLSIVFFPSMVQAQSSSAGFGNGVTWMPFTPLKKVTFVQSEPGTYRDDYSYIAAVPSSVFYDKASGTIYTSPLLFYEESPAGQTIEDRSADARQGIDYFMQDWMGYCGGSLDQITTVNVPRNTLNAQWSAKNTTTLEGNDSYTLAGSLALHDWSYSSNAVVAVIDENNTPPINRTERTINGSLSPAQGLVTQHFEVPKTNDEYPIYNDFTVPDGYKMLTVRSWYPCFYLEAGVPGFQGLINMSIPAGDRDVQVYCEKNGQWMMTGITEAWNAQEGMDTDKTSTYVYNSGRWSVALTDIPTKSSNEMSDVATVPPSTIQKHHTLGLIAFGRYGRFIDILKNMRVVTYQVDVTMYPGTLIEIPDLPPFGCRNAHIDLTWNDPSAALGFSLIGPSGEEILSTREPGVSTTCANTSKGVLIPLPKGTETNMHLEGLGECLPGEHYQLCVYAESPINKTISYSISYSWDQNYSRRLGDSLASASEGAVLASLMNTPLLYTRSSSVPSITKTALSTLGVTQMTIVDLGGYLSSNARGILTEGIKNQRYLTGYNETYQCIKSISQKNDIVFSTISSWTSLDSLNLCPGPEEADQTAVGPATYIAAEHGCPVFLIENHPELSSAVIYHNELWRRHPDGISKLPTVSEMYLTGRRVYSFIKQLGFDEEGPETIITVGGQFEIGLSWDRMFVGKAYPGRFFGDPTDLSVWICKNVFYPQLVFQNPAIADQSGVTLINGSSSKRRFPWYGKLGLKITTPSKDVTIQYPALDTLICYDEKFNTRASAYWGFVYKCADGTIPGISESFNPIDDGVMVAVNGKKGAFFPDLSGSEVQPFYLERAGYTPVFSTNFSSVMHDLDQGVLLWMLNTHGGPRDGGILMFWDPNHENPNPGIKVPFAAETKEPNPWRGYEWLMGSTTEPDTMTMEIHGILAALIGNPNPRISLFTTALDWALAKKPMLDIIGRIASLPILRLVTPEWLRNTQDYYDGIVISLLLSRFGTSFYNGTQIDSSLGNIHSAVISSVACLPAGKYLQTSLMRHGSVLQIMDPWATSWYSDVWQDSVPRGIALGKTMGEIYTEGISKVGILYITDPPQWWWDLSENVCLYGDPDLRVWSPSTNYSSLNHWNETSVESLQYDPAVGFDVEGHTPFGAVDHPNIRATSFLFDIFLWSIVGVVLVLLVVGVILYFRIVRRSKK